MSHARQQIRDAVVTALTGAGLISYSSRAYSSDDLPSVNVTTPSESVEISTPGKQERLLTLTVSLMAEAASDVDDATDAQSVIIEKTILTDSSLLALVKYIDLDGMESELSGEGDKPIIVMEHTFSALYRTSESDPEVIIP